MKNMTVKIKKQWKSNYHIFRTISRTFFNSLAGPATYSQVRLIYQKIYNLTLSHVSLKIFPTAPQREFFFARAAALLEFYGYITLAFAWWK